MMRHDEFLYGFTSFTSHTLQLEYVMYISVQVDLGVRSYRARYV